MSVRFFYKDIEFEGISEGGIRTCVIVKKFNLMFDIGYIHPERIHIPNVLLTHAHIDHIAGVPYYISQRSLRKLSPPNIYVHREIYEKLEQILKLFSELEGFDYEYNLQVVQGNETIFLNNNHNFKALLSNHRIPSQGYTIYEHVKKLKPEYLGLDGRDIAQKKMQGENLVNELDIPMVSFSGDTTIEYVLQNKDVMESKILFLECTYIDEVRSTSHARSWGHIHLDEIVQYASCFKNEKLVLMHFSKRYSARYIKEIVYKKVPDFLRDRVHCFL
ncbi:MAG: MBL fold metallo-hydrolase [Leptospiraceae bacterium]|nr:MBL fold metallo-hydrolase [Leptospiraceae bacterium]MCP5495432.1 MBL fold metallo-hydrolase [Leptospiraceae bacterium]